MEVPAYRSFGIEYVAKLDGLEPGVPLRVWIPVPASGDHQTVSEVSVSISGKGLSHRFTEDPLRGNRILYVEGPAPAAELEVTLSYAVRRFERRLDLAKLPQKEISQAERERGLAPGRLVVIDERIRNEAKALEGDTPQALAQAAYDYVALQMVYDKSGEGWGRGDSLYACEVGKGNCTDYHAYFMALCAAREIPTRFEIGLFGPYDPRPGETIILGGYHCWAEFWAGSWIPVDISEGDKKEVSFFGVQTPNRVTLSRGRDLVLEPAQAGEPLNYFVNPYAEVAGKPHPGVSKSATWTEPVGP
jgi:transglutaminase-like putative cysteine protease